jgi:hypothetical protein
MGRGGRVVAGWMGLGAAAGERVRSAAQQDKTAPTFRAAALPAQAASRVPHPCLSAGPPARPPEPACRPLVGLLAEFRRAASKEVLREVAPLLKAYQEEVDRLTSRWVLHGGYCRASRRVLQGSVAGTAGTQGVLQSPARALQRRGCACALARAARKGRQLTVAEGASLAEGAALSNLAQACPPPAPTHPPQVQVWRVLLSGGVPAAL